MNIEAAAKKWDVKTRTVLEYIEKRYIIGISICDDEINIPCIPKPYIKKKPKTVKEKDKYICDALNHQGYANYRILGISKEEFKERLCELINARKIRIKDTDIHDYETTLNYTLLAFDDNKLIIAPTIAPTIDIKLADQIGLVNTKIATL